MLCLASLVLLLAVVLAFVVVVVTLVLLSWQAASHGARVFARHGAGVGNGSSVLLCLAFLHPALLGVLPLAPDLTAGVASHHLVVTASHWCLVDLWVCKRSGRIGGMDEWMDEWMGRCASV